MPLSTGKTGRGISFKINDVIVANVVSIGFDGREAEEIDFTHLLSDGGYREFRQGFKDPGTISINMQFDPTHPTHANGPASLEALLASGAEFTWKIDYSGAGWAAVWSGLGFVKGLSPSIGVDNPVEGAATVRVNGATTWTF
jgi:hypothetical protein